jgi:alpha-L-rhamnosidase
MKRCNDDTEDAVSVQIHLFIRMITRLLPCLMMLGVGLNAASEFRPVALGCEHLTNPVGIDVAIPRLSWRIEDPMRTMGLRQAAYRVLVASTRQRLDGDQADLWDSGKVPSSQSHLVPYGGKPLDSHAECHWKVKLWTGDGQETPWSAAAHFGIGLLRDSDWQGPWMTYGDDPETKKPVAVSKHLWFRRNLQLAQVPASAVVHLASIGYHELYINGRKADDRVLAPALTRLDKRVHYVSYDIARLLRSGPNVIAIHYGPGWARYDFFKTSPAIRVQFHGRSADGRVVSLHSDKHWRYRVAASENTGKWKWGDNGGERIDARRLVPDWNLPGHDDRAWANAVETRKEVTLSAEMIPPSKIIATLPATTIKRAGKTPGGAPVHEVILEKNFTGFLRIKVRGQSRGDRIRMTLADAPDPNSVFNQVSEYICSGAAEETFQHRFNYAAGRYLKIEGLRQDPRPADICGLAISNSLERTGSFTCSNDLFNRIYETDVWTFLSNTTEGFTADCPHRERMGYGEVAFATCWGIGLPNFESGALYSKLVRDWADVQEESGWIHHTAPQINQHFGGALWSSAGLNVAAETYLHHGDVRALEANHESAKRWLDFLQRNVEDGLLTPYNKHWGKFLGDWAAPGGRNERGDSPEARFFNNCVYARNLADFIRHSKALGKEDGLAAYQQRLERLLVRIHREFYKPETASYCNGTQVQQAFALLAGVCPPDQRDKVREKLFHDIRELGYFDMGSSGLPVLMKYMIEHSGRGELLALPLNRTTMPSYGFFLENGQTTWPEHWQPRTSNIHTCYTGIASWFIKSIGGIRPDPEHPGYQQFIIRPFLLGWLAHARASTASPYGTIVSEWKRANGRLTLDVVIPPNSSATVYLPTSEPQEFLTSPALSQAVSLLSTESDHVVLKVVAGHHSFDVALQP